MASSGNHVAASTKHFRVLLQFSCDSQRIPDELAEGIGAAEARVIGPSGGKVKLLRVEVGRDGDGAFLGRGWPEIAAAFGVGDGWFLVIRHHGRGVLTLKAFDASGCIRGLGTPSAEATTSSKYVSYRPQFISVPPHDFMEKMLIPARFVEHYIPDEVHKNSRMAIVIGSLGKVCRVEVEMNESNLFFRGGWSQVLVSHDATQANALLLKYEGNMVFTVRVFGPDGFQRESTEKCIGIQQASTTPDTGKQQEAPSEYIRKRKSKKDWPSREAQKKPKGSTVSMNEASKRIAVYEIGPPSWIKKEINTCTLRKKLSLSKSFCDAIGLLEPCTITLKTSMNSTESWKVCGLPCKNNSFVIVRGWMKFCREKNLKEGDICTFNIVERTLWHVVITPYKQDSTSASSRTLCCSKPNRKNVMSSSQGQKSPEGLMTTAKKVSPKTRCAFEVGPPAWIKKEVNNSAIENYLYLPRAFCDAIGLREPCTITLKTSMSSGRSWQVLVVPNKNTSHYVRGLDWKRFCEENEIKVGDVCTINIVETALWHVVIAHQ